MGALPYRRPDLFNLEKLPNRTKLNEDNGYRINGDDFCRFMQPSVDFCSVFMDFSGDASVNQSSIEMTDQRNRACKRPISLVCVKDLLVVLGSAKLPGEAIERARTANDDPGLGDAGVKPDPVVATWKPTSSA